MTALCPGGGPSRVIEGKGTTLVVSAGLVSGGLALISPWLIPFAALLDGFVFDLLGSCQVDPPALSPWTMDDLAGLVGGVLNPNYTASLQKLHDLVVRYFWFEYCECIGATTPAFVPPTPPSQVVVQIGSTRQPCWHGAASGPLNVGTPPRVDLGGALPLPTTTVWFGGQPYRALDMTGKSYTLVLNWSLLGQPSGNAAVVFDPHAFSSTGNASSDGVQITNAPIQLFIDASTTQTLNWPLTGWPATWYLVVNAAPLDNNPSPAIASLALDILCDQQPAGQLQGCCPPDASLLQLLQQINTTVTLIQRQSAPFAYVPGPTHSALTGSGELVIADLLGVKITPSTLPAVYGQQAGDPNELWLESWITWGNADGWSDRVWLRHSPQVSLPALGGQYTKLGYSLAPGLVVNITELVREP